MQSPATGITPVLTSYHNVQSDESMSVESENDYTALEESLLYHKSSSYQQSSDPVHQPFTHNEIVRFSRRNAEGYDIKTDPRYNYWLSLQDGATASAPSSPAPVLQPSSHSVVSKLIAAMPPERAILKFTAKSSARVLTSEECRKEINEKEKKKTEALKRKEERKIEHQRKQKEKQKILEEKPKKKEKSKNIILYVNISLLLGCTTISQRGQWTETGYN